MNNSLFLLWLDGINPVDLLDLPSINKLASCGIDLHLQPLPPFEKSIGYYQIMTGMGSGKLGRFDAVRPEKYEAIAETTIPEGALGRLPPDLLRSRKHGIAYLELDSIDPINQFSDCTIARLDCTGNHIDLAAIDTLVNHHMEMAVARHIFVLAEAWSQPASKLVNINDYLADIGLLEIKGARSKVNISWTETLAYGLGTGQVWINLKGRETQGCVASGKEYQEVRDTLIHELSTNWLDPQTQQPVVERVLRREEAYAGEYLFKAPDLIVVYRPGYVASPKAFMLDLDGVSIQSVGDSTSATRPQVRLIGSGPALVSGHTSTAFLIDIAPNILYLSGLSIPTHIDGKVLPALFTQEFRQQHPVKVVSDEETLLSDEEEGLIVDRLRDLGYLG